jgi:hypothetical protein
MYHAAKISVWQRSPDENKDFFWFFKDWDFMHLLRLTLMPLSFDVIVAPVHIHNHQPFFWTTVFMDLLRLTPMPLPSGLKVPTVVVHNDPAIFSVILCPPVNLVEGV